MSRRRAPGAGVTLALAGALLLTSSGVARADAIGPDPACPAGAKGESSHAGEWCAPWPCDAEGTSSGPPRGKCTDGATCRPMRVCSKTSQVERGRWRAPREPRETTPMEMVVGTCEPDQTCTGKDGPRLPTIGTVEDGDPVCKVVQACVRLETVPTPARSPATSSAAPGTSPAASASAPTGGGKLRAACSCDVAGAPDGWLPMGVSALALAAWWRRRRRRGGLLA